MSSQALILILLALAVLLIFLYVSKQKDKTRVGVVYSSSEPRPLKELPLANPPVERLGALQHPVLAYQRAASRGTVPATLGDPIRPLPVAGPMAIGTSYHMNNNGQAYAYEGYDGPYPGKALNIPVPQGALKMSSEKYRYPFYTMQQPLKPYDFFRPYGPNQTEQMSSEIVTSDTPFYKREPAGLGPAPVGSGVPFISSVNPFAPFPEVTTSWEKVGTLTTTDPSDNSILNLYRRPIAPLQDLFRYTVQDKNGFIIPLLNVNLLEDGDIVPSVQGKESKGPWRVNDYVQDKWVWS